MLAGRDACDVLVVAFFGTYRVGSLGNPDADYMRGQVMAGLAMYRPSCLLLDLRELEYASGNSLLGIFQDVDDFLNHEATMPFPVLTVVKKSAAALHSLLNVQMPSNIHHLDSDAALKAACTQAAAWVEA